MSTHGFALSQQVAMTEASTSVRQQTVPFRLRGGFYTLIVLELIDPDDLGFYAMLRDTMAQAPEFYRNAPVVIDLENLIQPRLNFGELVRRLRQCQFVPMGIQNGTDAHNEAAMAAGLAVLPPGGVAPVGTRPGSRNAPPKVKAGETLIITEPVRSGQQVYSSGDMVVIAAVGAGAELMAEGHIHVYGALRGRAFAGLSGDTSARIFCRSLEAEMVAIAGIWQIRDNLSEALIGRSAQISLENEKLRFQRLG